MTRPPVLTVEEVLRLADYALRLGEVERVPVHPDGRRRETDTTHSVMLALVAAVAADRLGLDPGRAALVALVHDLVEIYAGDTDTSRGLSVEESMGKQLREQEALGHMLAEIDSMPLIRRLLLEAEGNTSPEAKVVRLLDKAMPKAVRILERQHTGKGPPDDMVASHGSQQAVRLLQQFPEPALLPLHQVSAELRQMLAEPDGGGLARLRQRRAAC